MASDYVFLDEWDVDASPEAVFDALADARRGVAGSTSASTGG